MKSRMLDDVTAWRHVQTGGFYWAGACVQNGVLLVGTDDGQDSTSPVLSTGRVLLFDAATGALLDEVGGICGDVRSTICYDSGSKAYYATSKGGEFIRIKLNATGRKIDSKQTLKLQNGTTSVAMSTSTPVDYKGRAYVGVSGSSQFYAYSGHNITVIDLDGAMSIAYRVPTKGYPQASGLLTTAYENDENGGVYDYLIKELWGPSARSDNQILRVNMANIRRKIEKNPAQPEYIFTETGIGYRMVEGD